jgi:MoaA/NifB/PqqE/SkfB family radical SAM enzyme
LLRQAAPRGGRQVHVMTVLMRSNQQRLRRLLEQSASAGVGHSLTLLSTQGSRRDPELQNELPAPPLAAPLCDLWREFPHLRVFSDYLRLCERFVAGQPMPACPAGRQGFNIDHLGNLSHCIERIGQSVGNLRHEPLSAVLTRLRPADVAGCQDCLSLCRGFLQALGDGSSWRALAELGGRLRS